MRNLKLGLMALLLLFQGCNSNNKLKYHGREVLQGNPSEELQLKAVKMNDWNIRYIDHPYESVQRVVIEKNLSNFFYINNPSESIAIYALKSMTYANTPRQQLIDFNPIRVIKNPSEDLQLLAIKNSSDEVIKHIKNPTERVLSITSKLEKREQLMKQQDAEIKRKMIQRLQQRFDTRIHNKELGRENSYHCIYLECGNGCVQKSSYIDAINDYEAEKKLQSSNRSNFSCSAF